MTFTDADHDKAVELYRKYRTAEWWPKDLTRDTSRFGTERWSTGYEFVDDIYALSAIAWAMVERFNSITLVHRENRGWSVYLYGDWKPTRFLALAAAVEAIDAVP